MPRGKDTSAFLAKQLIAGTKKHFSSTASLMFGGTTSTPAQVESLLQGRPLVPIAASRVDAAPAGDRERRPGRTPCI